MANHNGEADKRRSPVELRFLDPKRFSTHEEIRAFVRGPEYERLAVAVAIVATHNVSNGHPDPELYADAQEGLYSLHVDLTQLAQLAASDDPPQPFFVGRGGELTAIDRDHLKGIRYMLDREGASDDIRCAVLELSA